MAVVVAVWCTSWPCITDQQASIVLDAWAQQGFVGRVLHVRTDERHVVAKVLQVVAALDAMTPVIVVSVGTTALLSTDWNTWRLAWMRANKWLWCTACHAPSATVLALHARVTLQVPNGPKGPLPAWGVLGGMAYALLAHLDPVLSMHQAIGQAWAQDKVYVDDTAPSRPLAWVWECMWPTQAMPTSFTGPHTRLQKALRRMTHAPDRVAALGNTWTALNNRFHVALAMCILLGTVACIIICCCVRNHPRATIPPRRP